MAETSIEEELAAVGQEVEQEVTGAGGGKCPFCEIGAGNIPAKKVYEDDATLAFLDINPRNPGHTLVIPKKHFATILDITDGEMASLAKTVKKVAAAVQKGTGAQGISVSQSNGAAAGQMVPHMHFHVIPRFAREGPVALEGILQVKKMPDEALDKVVEAVKAGFSGGPAPAPAAPKTVAAEKRPPAPAKKEPKEEDINFDF